MKYKEISKRCKILVVEACLSFLHAKDTCQTSTNNSESTLKCDLMEITATFESTRECVFVSSKIFYPHKEWINNFPWKLRRTLYKKSCSLIDFIENLFCNFRWNAWSSLKGRLGKRMKMVICNNAFCLHTFKWVYLVLHEMKSIYLYGYKVSTIIYTSYFSCNIIEWHVYHRNVIHDI